jgi:hypothetical protein
MKNGTAGKGVIGGRMGGRANKETLVPIKTVRLSTYAFMVLVNKGLNS